MVSQCFSIWLPNIYKYPNTETYNKSTYCTGNITCSRNNSTYGRTYTRTSQS